MSEYALRIEYLPNAAGDCHHVHIWQRLLGEHAACIHVVPCREAVHRASECDLSIGFNKEADRWRAHLCRQACGRRFDYSANAAEALYEFLPAAVESTHRQASLLGKLLREYANDAINQLLIDFDLLAADLRQALDAVYIQRGMASPRELIINFEDPCVNVEIVRY